jgi:hypothetical protein
MYNADQVIEEHNKKPKEGEPPRRDDAKRRHAWGRIHSIQAHLDCFQYALLGTKQHDRRKSKKQKADIQMFAMKSRRPGRILGVQRTRRALV